MYRYRCRRCGYIATGHLPSTAMRDYRYHRIGAHPREWLPMPARLPRGAACVTRQWPVRRIMAQTRPTWRLYCRLTRRYSGKPRKGTP